MTVKVTNNGFSTLAAGINNSVTTVTVASGQGARFPSLSTDEYFYATLIDSSNNLEVIKVTARSTDSMTVVRGQDNTSARAFSLDDRIELRPVAKLFEDIQAGSSLLTSTGALNAGSITSGFGTIDTGSSTITTTGEVNVGRLNLSSTVSSGDLGSDKAQVGYASSDGLLLMGQGSSSDVALINDEGVVVGRIPTGTTTFQMVGSGQVTAATGGILYLSTTETTVVANDSLGLIHWSATGEEAPDGTAMAGAIQCLAEDTFSASANPTKMVFQLGVSESATTKMTLASNGNLTLHSGSLTTSANAASGFASHFINDGDNTNRFGIGIQAGADDSTGTNYAVLIYDGDATAQGFITFSSGTVTYGAFTAHHEVSLPDADKANGYPYGTLMEQTAIYYTQKDGADTERGIRYVTQKSSSQYSRKILGAYFGDLLQMADSSGTYANNLHQVSVLGDGHIICNNSGGNISVGDGICASATAGIGQKADKLCMIMGIAQKDVTFSGDETVLVPVQFGVQQFTPWTD